MSFDPSELRRVHSHNSNFQTESANGLCDQWAMGPVNLQSETPDSSLMSEPLLKSVSHNGDFRTETTNKLWDLWGMGPVNLQSQTPSSPVISGPFMESDTNSDDQDTMNQDSMVPIIPADDFSLIEQMEQLGRLLEERRSFRERFRLPHEPRTRPFKPTTHMLPIERTSDFKYTPLTNGHFRLVALHPGRGMTDLQCTLFTLRFDLVPSYEAFSYAWGDPTRLHRVRCGNGDITQGKMIFPLGPNESIKVSPNLRDALYRLRWEDDFRLLWIDAICIHQDDDREKDDQVQRMAEIYSKAAKVLIWLGEEDNETRDAFNFIEQLTKREVWLRTKYPNLQEEEEPLRTFGVRPWLMPKSSPGYVPVELWEAFRKLLRQRSWFMRTWVFQEVIMAKEASVHCGSQVVDWNTFYKACALISDLGIHNFDIYSSSVSQGEQASEMVQGIVIKGVIREARRSAASLNRSDRDLGNWLSYAKLESLLISTRFSSCLDPRDKIYALLSMVADKKNIPRVDYGLSVRDSYVNVAKYWVETNLRNTDNLSIFFSSVQTANPLHRLPSWVPDWSTPPVAQRLGAEDTLCAAGDTLASMHFVPHETSSTFFKPAEVHFFDYHVTNSVDFVPNRNESENYYHKDTSLEAVGFCVLEVKATERRRTLSYENEHAELIKEFQDPYPTTTESYSEVYPKVVNPRGAADFHRQPVDKDNLKFWEYITEPKKNLTKDMVNI